MIKGNAIAEFLADRIVEKYEPMKFEFPNEYLMAIFQIGDESTKEDLWKLYFDRAFNALGHGIGAVLISPKVKYCLFIARFDFDYTNNVTEYEACMLGLQVTIKKKVKRLNVYGGLALVICQLNGERKTRDLKLVPY